MVHPILDQFYDRSPHHRRSAAFVKAKGLAANEKGSAGLGTPPVINTPPMEADAPAQAQPKKYVPTIPFSTTTTRTRTAETTVPRVRTPLSHTELAPTETRSLTVPQATSHKHEPAQGNIKKKRASLTTIDPFSGVAGLHEASPVTPEPTRTEFGNPNKIAQYFPELSMS